MTTAIATATRSKWRPGFWPTKFRAPHTLFVGVGRVHAWSPDAEGGDEPSDVPTVRSWLEAHPSTRPQVVLSGTLTRQIVASDSELALDEPGHVASWAAQQLASYHGQVALTWPVEPWILAGQRGACASHGFDLAGYLQDAKEHRVSPCRVEPWWSVALRASDTQTPGLTDASDWSLVMVENLLVTAVFGQARRVVGITQRRLEESSTAALRDLLGGPGAAEPPERSVCIVGYGLNDSGPWPSFAVVPHRLDTLFPPLSWVRT